MEHVKFGMGSIDFQGAEAQRGDKTSLPMEVDHPIRWKVPLVEVAPGCSCWRRYPSISFYALLAGTGQAKGEMASDLEDTVLEPYQSESLPKTGVQFYPHPLRTDSPVCLHLPSASLHVLIHSLWYFLLPRGPASTRLACMVWPLTTLQPHPGFCPFIQSTPECVCFQFFKHVKLLPTSGPLLSVNPCLKLSGHYVCLLNRYTSFRLQFKPHFLRKPTWPPV